MLIWAAFLEQRKSLKDILQLSYGSGRSRPGACASRHRQPGARCASTAQIYSNRRDLDQTVIERGGSAQVDNAG